MLYSVDNYNECLQFAAERHVGQKMLGGELPYLVHVVMVANEIISQLPTLALEDPDLAIACALLHDTLEDTRTTSDELRSRFGTKVAEGVDALTKRAVPNSMADSLARIQAQAREIWIVKLADRTTNMDTPPKHWSLDKRRGYREEAVRIADALGRAAPALDTRLRSRIARYPV